ncbi:MAG: hypothetical protein U0441_13565 [Polyangiaceae bacterium]
MRLHLHEEVPLERLGLDRAPSSAAPERGAAPATSHLLLADWANWRPRLASSATLIAFTLLGAVPAAALAEARMLATMRRPHVGFTVYQVGMGLLLTALVTAWSRRAQGGRTLLALGAAAITAILATPALIFWRYPILAEPAAELTRMIARTSSGLVLTAAALPPLLLAFHVTENTDCHTSSRVAFTSGVWLTLVAAVTQIGAPRWFAFCAGAAALVSAGLVLFAARRSSRDASALEGVITERNPRLRVIQEPERAAALPPDLVPIGAKEGIAWLIRTDAAGETPYRAAATGVPIAAIPVPTDRAARQLRRRGRVGYSMGGLALALAAAELGQPGPRRIVDLLLTEDRVMVQLSDGTVESALASFDRYKDRRAPWELLSSSGVLATTDPRLLHDKPAQVFRGDGQALLPLSADKTNLQLVAGRMHACALHADGTVWCWGENNAGQLGRPVDLAWGQPGEVDGITDAVEVRAHGDISCARTREERVYCWGFTERRFTDIGPIEAPREVSELPDVVRFEVDERGVCGVRPDGRLACYPERVAPRDGD